MFFLWILRFFFFSFFRKENAISCGDGVPQGEKKFTQETRILRFFQKIHPDEKTNSVPYGNGVPRKYSFHWSFYKWPNEKKDFRASQCFSLFLIQIFLKKYLFLKQIFFLKKNLNQKFFWSSSPRKNLFYPSVRMEKKNFFFFFNWKLKKKKGS